jgi:hypothetical protein
MPSKGSLGLDRQCLNQKSSVSTFNLMKDQVSKELSVNALVSKMRVENVP